MRDISDCHFCLYELITIELNVRDAYISEYCKISCVHREFNSF